MISMRAWLGRAKGPNAIAFLALLVILFSVLGLQYVLDQAVGANSSTLYIVTDYIDGANLSEWLNRATIDLRMLRPVGVALWQHGEPQAVERPGRLSRRPIDCRCRRGRVN